MEYQHNVVLLDLLKDIIKLSKEKNSREQPSTIAESSLPDLKRSNMPSSVTLLSSQQLY